MDDDEDESKCDVDTSTQKAGRYRQSIDKARAKKKRRQEREDSRKKEIEKLQRKEKNKRRQERRKTARANHYHHPHIDESDDSDTPSLASSDDDDSEKYIICLNCTHTQFYYYCMFITHTHNQAPMIFCTFVAWCNRNVLRNRTKLQGIPKGQQGHGACAANEILKLVPFFVGITHLCPRSRRASCLWCLSHVFTGKMHGAVGTPYIYN